MDITTYQGLAQKTLKELPPEMHVLHMYMGLVGELGELVDAYKKHYIYGKPLDVANIREELGDLFWYAVNLYGGVVKLTPLGRMYDVRLLSELPHEEACMSLLNDVEDTLRVVHLIPYVKSMADIIPNLHALTLRAGLTVEEVLQTNYDKLAKRYGDKYSDEAAINRNLEQERKILEKNL